MFGVNIFVHAVKMVLNNLGTALRISLGPMLLVFVLVVVFGAGVVLTRDPAMAEGGAASALGVFITTAVLLVVMLWIAVAWHRFVLREETPTGVLPPFHGGAIGAYVWAGVIVGLVLFVVAIPFALLAGLLVAPIVAGGGQPGAVTGFVAFAIFYFPVAYVGYRISPILPSAALQARMPLKEAWYATGTSGSAFLVLTLVSIVAGYLIGLPGQALPPFLSVIWAFGVQWLTVMVGASVLTTIYGHYVEGRALNV